MPWKGRADSPSLDIDREDRACLRRFRVFSAAAHVLASKHQGVPLDRLARRGEEVEPALRPVEIRELSHPGNARRRVRFRVVCSKGTYIRTLASDMGRALECGAHLEALRR